MNQPIQDVYVLAATRTAVGKAPRGAYRTTRPDTLLAHVLRGVLAQAPALDPSRIDDVVVGCAMPEYEQGMNVARMEGRIVIEEMLERFPTWEVDWDRAEIVHLGSAIRGYRTLPITFP